MNAPHSINGGLDFQSRLFLRRFAITLAGISFAAFAFAPHSPWQSLAGMTLLAAMMDSIIASLRRDPLNGRSLTYWDGSAGFLGVSCLIRLMT